MLGPEGMVAYILTFHRLSLGVALLIGGVSLLPYLVAVRNRSGAKRFLLAGALFVGVTLTFHGVFSWLNGVKPFRVEVVQLAPLEGE